VKRSVFFLSALTLFVSLLAVAQQNQNSARQYLQKAAEVMGGEQALRNIKTERTEYLGHRFFLEQSERPDGPWIIGYDTGTEFRDYVHGGLRQDSVQRGLGQEEGSPSSATTVEGITQANVGDKHRPGSLSQLAEAEEALDFSADRLVLHGLDAADLRSFPDVSIHGEPYHVVAFTYAKVPVRLFLNAYTGLPGVVEWTQTYPSDIYWRGWGDVRNRQEFTNYSLLPGGIRLPLQSDLTRNDQPCKSRVVLKRELNLQLAQDTFAIAPEVRAAFEKIKTAALETPAIGKPQEIVEGDDSLVLFRGAWNASLIKQPDGLIILEAPIGPKHTRDLLEQARQRYPNTPIKAVITTSDAWPHFGGLREMVANNIPVYATDLNQPILTRFINSPFTLAPDSLAKSHKLARFHWISSKTVLGTGPNRLELYPIRNASGERYLMVYFPERRILYVSDLAQHQQDGTFFMPEYLKEIADAAEREHLTVERFFAMHMPMTAWSELQQGLNKATAESPNSSASK